MSETTPQPEDPSTSDRPATDEAPTTGADTDVAHLTYEEARDELASIVARLESGQVGLEQSMSLWQRGDALAAHCNAWLDRAEQTLADGEAARREW